MQPCLSPVLSCGPNESAYTPPITCQQGEFQSYRKTDSVGLEKKSRVLSRFREVRDVGVGCATWASDAYRGSGRRRQMLFPVILRAAFCPSRAEGLERRLPVSLPGNGNDRA